MQPTLVRAGSGSRTSYCAHGIGVLPLESPLENVHQDKRKHVNEGYISALRLSEAPSPRSRLPGSTDADYRDVGFFAILHRYMGAA